MSGLKGDAPKVEGERVFAAARAEQDTVWLFGTGTYVGKHPRPGSGPPWTQEDINMVRTAIASVDNIEPETVATDQVDALLHHMSLNPKIVLDSGETVWGYECWWGPETGLDEMVRGRTVEYVSITECRDNPSLLD